MRGIWTTLSARPTAFSNERFYGTLEWKLPADNAVRTAEIGGRSRQAQEDHEGRLGSELAVGKSHFNQSVGGELTDSGHRDPLHRKAVAERLGEEVCLQDNLRQVAKSAVWAETRAAAMIPMVTKVGILLHRQTINGKGGCGTTRAARPSHVLNISLQ